MSRLSILLGSHLCLWKPGQYEASFQLYWLVPWIYWMKLLVLSCEGWRRNDWMKTGWKKRRVAKQTKILWMVVTFRSFWFQSCIMVSYFTTNLEIYNSSSNHLLLTIHWTEFFHVFMFDEVWCCESFYCTSIFPAVIIIITGSHYYYGDMYGEGEGDFDYRDNRMNNYDIQNK